VGRGGGEPGSLAHRGFLHADIEEHSSATDVVVGIDAYRTQLEAVFAALPDFHTVLEDRFTTDDRVVCR